MIVWKSTVVMLTVLLTGCATGTKMSPEQRASIQSIAVTNTQEVTDLKIEYRIKGSSTVAATAGLVGLVAVHALNAPRNRNKKMDALIKARAFNQLVGTFNSADELGHDLNAALGKFGVRVESDAQAVLTTEIKNCLSEDTRTFQVHTDYRLQNSSGDSLLQNTAQVQYTIARSWTKEKLQKVRRSAVREVAKLIALDITGQMVVGEKSEAPFIQGTDVYSVDMYPIESLSSEQYLRLQGNNGYLVSVASESDDVRVRAFYADSRNCN